MNGILVEALVEGLQARLPFSPDDRKELDYQLRVGQFAGFINGLSLFYCSNKLVTGAGDRVRVYPGIYEVYVRRANEDPTEPVTVVNCSRQNQREASFRVVQPRVLKV